MPQISIQFSNIKSFMFADCAAKRSEIANGHDGGKDNLHHTHVGLFFY